MLSNKRRTVKKLVLLLVVLFLLPPLETVLAYARISNGRGRLLITSEMRY